MRLRLAFLLAVVGMGLAVTRADRPASVTIAVSKDQIEFKSGDALIARYHIASTVAKPYMWPVNGPGGIPLTRTWPMEKGQPGETVDHVHQKSMWFCHGDVIPEGIELTSRVRGVEGVDYWSEAKGHGRIVCTKVDEPQVGKDFARVATSNEWVAADGTKILDERRTIALYNLGEHKLFVFDIDMAASYAPIVFGDTKEGSFGIRISDLMTEKSGNGKLENADGKIGMKACWGNTSAWCDYSGTLQERKVGLAILADPANPVAACWHSRDYGLMAANPFGRVKSGFPAMKEKSDLVKLAKGEHLKLRFGLLIHPGDAKEGKVAEFYDRFVKLAN